MKEKYFNLQLFTDGSEGGTGNTGAGTGTVGNGNGGQNAGGATYSYEQAEQIAQARAERAEKAALSDFFKRQGMSEDEVTSALADFRAKKAASRPNVDAITMERDKALAELADMKNNGILRKKGVHDEDIDYVMFNIKKAMKGEDKPDFEKAADKYLKDNPRFANGYTVVKTGTDGSASGGGIHGGNEAINNAIRRAAGRY